MPLPLLRPRALRDGDTLGLFNPSGAVYEREPYERTHEALRAMGFRVREAPNLRARHGHMAGTPQQRADDIHTLLADPEVAGLLAVTGGAGAARVLPLLDYERFARTPKFIGGFSDLTALLTAVHVRTGLVTFHAPLGRSAWNRFSTRCFRAVAGAAEPAVLGAPDPAQDGSASDDSRLRTLRGGVARGPLVGGNLAVLTALAGTPSGSVHLWLMWPKGAPRSTGTFSGPRWSSNTSSSVSEPKLPSLGLQPVKPPSTTPATCARWPPSASWLNMRSTR